MLQGPGGRMKFRRIKELDCLEELNNKLALGEQLARVAQWLQQDKKVLVDMTEGSLITTLSDYRRNGMSAIKVLDHNAKDMVDAAVERLNKGLDEIEELEKLFKFQKERVEMGHNVEKTVKFLGKLVGPEVSLLVQILKTSHEIKSDLGVNGGRNLGTLTVQEQLVAGSARYGEGIQKALQDPEARGKVLSLVQRLAAKSGTDDS